MYRGAPGGQVNIGGTPFNWSRFPTGTLAPPGGWRGAPQAPGGLEAFLRSLNLPWGGVGAGSPRTGTMVAPNWNGGAVPPQATMPGSTYPTQQGRFPASNPTGWNYL
jgi:hypothetical protein